MNANTENETAAWTFFTNHAHVLFCLVREPEQTLRNVAERVGITERAVQRIVRDLEDGGVLIRQRVGRRNIYSIDSSRRLRHPIEGHCRIAELIALVLGSTDGHRQGSYEGHHESTGAKNQ